MEACWELLFDLGHHSICLDHSFLFRVGMQNPANTVLHERSQTFRAMYSVVASVKMSTIDKSRAECTLLARLGCQVGRAA